MTHLAATRIVVPTFSRWLLAFTVLGSLTLGCSKTPGPPEGSKPAETTALDPNRAPIGGPAGHYAGSDACRDCHSVQFDAWKASRHHATLRPWDGKSSLRLASQTMPASFKVASDGSIVGPGTDGNPVSGRVAFLIGGRHREDLLVRLTDERVQVFPLSFDVDRSEAFEPLRELAGGTSPPPDVLDFWTRAGRNADLACYGCHATGQTIVSRGVSPSGLALPGSRWIEPGVGCEGCHGPGGPHVNAARAGNPDVSTLAMRRGQPSVDACAACHALRDVLPSPCAGAPAHRYGEPVQVAADPLLSAPSNFEFRDPFFDDLRPATFQQEAVAFSQSGCARQGGMTCEACHDVHSGAPTPALAAADGGDALCGSCHGAIARLGRRHTFHAPGTSGSRCLDCHMAAIVRGPGRVPARDHSMSPPVAREGKVPAACTSCHAAETAAAVAEAWRRVAAGPASKRRHNIGLAVEGAETARGVAALVRLAADRNEAWFLRWAAVQRITNAVTAIRTEPLAAMLLAMLDDPNPSLRRAGSRGLGRFGRATDLPALRKAAQDPDPWTALAAAHALVALRAPDAALMLDTVTARPDLVDDARAQYALGHQTLLARDLAHAETTLRRALTLNPMMVGAMNDLGLSLMGQGKGLEAVAEWQRALEINPRFGAARQNMDATIADPPASR